MRDKASEYLHVKVRIARDHIGVSQGYIQRMIGVPQSRTSQYENQIMEAIPTVFWEYLATNGINMSAMLNPAVTPDQFRDILKKQDPGVVVTARVSECDKCASREQEIALLRQVIEAKEELIAQYRRSPG